MAGQVPQTPPPGFGAAYADRQLQQQQLESRLVGSDLDRRAGLMGNIISNAPNIAALSGVRTVDQLANMFGDAETPIFDNQYGQQGDQLRRAEQFARLNAIRSGGASAGTPKSPYDTPGNWYQVTFPDGTVQEQFVPYNELDSVPWQQGIQGAEARIIPTPLHALSPYVQRAPQSKPANTGTIIHNKETDTWTMNGVTVDRAGNIVSE